LIHAIKIRFIVLLLVLTGSNCIAALPDHPLIRLASTSTDNSGLLQYPLNNHAIAVATGETLQLARHGDADPLLVHAPRLKQIFVAENYWDNRHEVMENDFVILAPPDDPAQIAINPGLVSSD
jgi:tungstate transport system substrate-binding protein